MQQKYFNIAGPCNQAKHYMLNPLRNIGNELMNLIENEQYFVIHAARQSGKTTLLWELTDKINAEGKYYALYCSLESLQALPDLEKGIPEIVRQIQSCLKRQHLPSGFAKDANYDNFSNVLNDSFADYCNSLDKPLAVFFDESDCLSNGTLISFLRQLRNGFVSRARIPFIHSLALVGMRNIRDDSETLGSSSPFNIVSKSFNLSTFTHSEVSELYIQHTAATGQIFEPQAEDYIFEQTDGQPWLVNAIARECVESICKKNYSIPITQEMAKTAINTLVLNRPTHFDSLRERLKEPRVRKIIEPLILGENVDITTDDYLYAQDLGLIKESSKGVIPSNLIYSEVIVRFVNQTMQEAIKNSKPNSTLPKYIVNNKIDINYLLKDFQAFWRENSEIWTDIYEEGFYQYKEAATHLTLQAYLQRVLNGGGHILREMALGRKRADICIEWEGQKYPIEIKILRNEKTISDGLVQLSEYMDRCAAQEGWLVVFDKGTEKSWDEKLYVEERGQITVFGC